MSGGMPQDVLDKLMGFIQKRGAQLIGEPYETPGGDKADIPSGPYWRCRIQLADGSRRRVYYNMMYHYSEELPAKWLYADRPKKEVEG